MTDRENIDDSGREMTGDRTAGHGGPEAADDQNIFGDYPADFRSGYVGLVGPPNVGKSTLMNKLVGQKLSIVSRKPQTTRHRVLGILTDAQQQAVFLDTPGFLEPQYPLHKAMMHAVHQAVEEADVLVFMVDAARSKPEKRSLQLVREHKTILALNKIDTIPQAEALPLVELYSAEKSFEAIIPISALTGFNVDVLRHEIYDRLPEGPPLYPPEMISEQPERFFIAEIIREKIFELYHREIPFSTQVNIVEYREQPSRKDVIHAEIVVERASQKGILIGRGGRALKRTGTLARKDIEALLERGVYLELHVKVREDWRSRDSMLRSFGYRT